MKISADEELLIARCHEKDPKAVKALAEMYGRPVYGFLRSAFGTRASMTHGLLAEVFTESVLEIDPFQEKVPFLALVMQRLVGEIQHRFKHKESSGTLPGIKSGLCKRYQFQVT